MYGDNRVTANSITPHPLPPAKKKKKKKREIETEKKAVLFYYYYYYIVYAFRYNARMRYIIIFRLCPTAQKADLEVTSPIRAF